MSTIIFCPRCRKQFTHSNHPFERCPHCERRVENPKYSKFGFWDDVEDNKVRVAPDGSVPVTHYVTLKFDTMRFSDVLPKGSKGTIHSISNECVRVKMHDHFDVLDEWNNELIWNDGPVRNAIEEFKDDIAETVRIFFSK